MRAMGEATTGAIFPCDVNRKSAAASTVITSVLQNPGIEHLDGTSAIVVTITIGIAVVHPTLERSREGFVQLADEALYAARRAGRNRGAVFESEYDELSTGIFKRR